MSTLRQIADQLRASNKEHVRAVIEPDDVMVLLDHLEFFMASEKPAEPEVAEAPANSDQGFEQVADIEPEPIVNDADQSVAAIAEPESAPEAPKQGKLPADFPGHQALADAGIHTFAQARKQRDSKDGLRSIPFIGEATAAKIEEAL